MCHFFKKSGTLKRNRLIKCHFFFFYWIQKNTEKKWHFCLKCHFWFAKKLALYTKCQKGQFLFVSKTCSHWMLEPNFDSNFQKAKLQLKLCYFRNNMKSLNFVEFLACIFFRVNDVLLVWHRPVSFTQNKSVCFNRM